MQIYSKHRPRPAALWAVVLALVLLLSACGGQQEEDIQEAGPFTVTARVAAAQDTLDPAASTAQGNETLLLHLFENLMRWEDDGSGHAVLAPGQAESYEVETDYAGNATYTFTLRDDIQWSDGQAVTAEDFAAAWRRLADPASDLPHRALLADVAGYSDVQETGDPSLLGVSAPDERTLVVHLVGSCAYFLEEVCAGAHTMPVRQDQIESGVWGGEGTATNGAYTLTSLDSALVTLEKSETYYDSAAVGPEVLRFVPVSGSAPDYEALTGGEADLVVDLPEEALQVLAGSGSWLPDPVTATYGLLLNTRTEPFTDPNVRLALRLAIDTQAVTEAAGELTLRAAPGLIPYGISDYGAAAPAEEEEDAAQSTPDPNAADQPQEPDPFWDFRTHSLEMVTAATSGDYADSCARARSLLAQAGFPDGAGFPAVEYIYVASDAGSAAAQAVTAMWRQELGITVTARAVSQEEYDAMLSAAAETGEESGGTDSETETAEAEEAEAPAPFQIAAQDFTAAYSDAKALLKDFYSTNAGNHTGYASEAFDILMESAAAAVSPEARDAYLHDAEAILLVDAPVIPLYCEGLSWQLREGLTGLYRAPDGVFFFYRLSPVETGA